MPPSACYKCQQEGHWAKDCPAGTGTHQGICLVLTAKTVKNNGRQFYRCPKLFEWCNAPQTAQGYSGRDADRWSPLAGASGASEPKLVCPCGAGNCSVLTAKMEKNAGRRFYKCPVQQGQASEDTRSLKALDPRAMLAEGQQFDERLSSCGFFKWCDEAHGSGYRSTPASASQAGDRRREQGAQSGGGGCAGECYKCGQEGHWSSSCPLRQAPFGSSSDSYRPGRDSNYGAASCGDSGRGVRGGGRGSGGTEGATRTCYTCGELGHWSSNCPTVIGKGGGGRGGQAWQDGGSWRDANSGSARAGSWR
eukprot:jgi/Mesen1/9155/ME000059S08571